MKFLSPGMSEDTLAFCFYESTVFDCNEILLPESVKHAVGPRT